MTVSTDYESAVKREKGLAYARGRAAVDAGEVTEEEFFEWWCRRPSDETLYLTGLAKVAIGEMG